MEEVLDLSFDRLLIMMMMTFIHNLPENKIHKRFTSINPLNAELNPICHLLALLGVHHILHISRIRVNLKQQTTFVIYNYHGCLHGRLFRIQTTGFDSVML